MSDLTKTVLNKIRKENISDFNESRTVSMKVLTASSATDLKTEIKGSKCKDCAGFGIHCVDHRKNVWSKLLFYCSTKALSRPPLNRMTNCRMKVYLMTLCTR